MHLIQPFDIVVSIGEELDADLGGNNNIDGNTTVSSDDEAVSSNINNMFELSSVDYDRLNVNISITGISAKLGYHDIKLFTFIMASWDQNSSQMRNGRYSNNGMYYNDDRRTASNSDTFSDSDFDTSSKPARYSVETWAGTAIRSYLVVVRAVNMLEACMMIGRCMVAGRNIFSATNYDWYE